MTDAFINELTITNFKSIKALHITPKKVNILIGRPNSGKSNILEAIGLFSAFTFSKTPIRELIRLDSYSNLFYDSEIGNSIKIELNNHHYTIEYIKERFEITKDNKTIAILDDDYNQKLTDSSRDLHIVHGSKNKKFTEVIFNKRDWVSNKIKFYRYKSINKYRKGNLKNLEAPFGNNLVSVIQNSSQIREEIGDIMSHFDMELQIRSENNEIQLVKRKKGFNVAFSMRLTADTLKTLIFHTVAVRSNENSILLFEEPENHTFPFYTKSIGELIAEDQSNQFFIATHNPYLLEAILDEEEESNICVYLIYSKDFDTKVKLLSNDEIRNLRLGDPFFSLNKFEE
ncbi:MAG: AAA family ATPase [Candidatus Heimdallarchaeota archaeon]|nr:AAA family ATPase [Candidatus Heimdallarchaeota archaeon]